MRRRLPPLAFLAAFLAPFPLPAPALAIDLPSAQRGYAVYAGVCSACHSMRQVTYADLRGLGLDASQVRAIAASHRIIDGVDASGRPLRRAAQPDDHLPSPFPTDADAQAANNGALPPDMSRLALTLPGHADYIARLLTGYRPAPAGMAIASGSYYNIAAAGRRIAMPPPLHDGQVSYADGTRATAPQMAHDVAAFLDWTARPHLGERRRIGASVILYLALLIGLAVILKRRIWSNVS